MFNLTVVREEYILGKAFSVACFVGALVAVLAHYASQFMHNREKAYSRHKFYIVVHVHVQLILC